MLFPITQQQSTRYNASLPPRVIFTSEASIARHALTLQRLTAALHDSLPLNPRRSFPHSDLYHLIGTLPASMSATPPIDPTSDSTRSTDAPLHSAPPTNFQNREAGPSSVQNDQATISSITEIPGPQNSSRCSSIERNRQEIFKGKTMTELKKEFEEKCAEIDKEHPELARKEGNYWDTLHAILKDRDAKDVKNHYENIDTLLVFAGLYSAILTAFVVEAYKLLQRDSSDASLQVLIQISQQLGSFAVTPGFANATYVPLSLPSGPFIPARSSVWLNGLWFVALILSLATASLGMLVKQWLREYLNLPDVKPEAQRRIQLFRVRGLRKYRVSEIAAFLPLLLQTSLILFFAGLVLFTRSIHTAIGWVITGFVVAWGTFLVITTTLPWFLASCPYKTPFLKSITLQFKRLLNNLNQRLMIFSLHHFRWLSLELPYVLFGDDAETQASKNASLDDDVLVDAYKTSGNADVWETVMYCAVDLQDPSASLARLPSVINKRHFPDETSKTLTFDTWLRLSWDQDQLFVKNLATCVRLRLVQAFEENLELDDDIVESLLQLNEYSDVLRRSPGHIDHAIEQLSSVVLEGALSAPFASGSLVKYALGLLGRGVDSLRKWEKFGTSAMSAFIEASNEFFGHPGISNDENDRELVSQCCGIVFCAGRATEESQALLEHEFSQLSRHIASKVKSLPDPSSWQDYQVVFEWHFVLDMAMRLHKRIPDIIDKTMFEALHTRSVKMFDLYVEHRRGEKFGKYIKGKPERVSQTLDASIGTIDWHQVLKEYTEVEVRGVGKYTEYRDEWDYQRLRVDCKHRMEFMLNYEDDSFFATSIREGLNNSQF
ncbi:hypothetical protein NLI96_g11512 [Meripilus lineatus]|uniref:DUF6535 domain-containing protein n=1 Tax=Meripilus lineatus TaxID=2056292 RepID=A0AAD5URP5_9APHY|nr:hypothetical protein NLI96_g11512 [Physisporinus lineatus]